MFEILAYCLGGWLDALTVLLRWLVGGWAFPGGEVDGEGKGEAEGQQGGRGRGRRPGRGRGRRRGRGAMSRSQAMARAQAKGGG